MPLALDDLTTLLAQPGARQYGNEAVSQLEHALQCAQLAGEAGETPQTIVACLLHDLGHLLAAERDSRPEHDTRTDDLHQYMALPFLRGTFGDAVLQPIRLHVDAKRYLCRHETGYWEALSPASKHSLEQQGGIFDDTGAQAFLAQPFAAEAIRLRRYDDLAKVPGKRVPELSHYLPLLRQAARG